MYLIYVIAFIIPIALYKHIEIAQCIMLIIWLVVSNSEYSFAILPAWVLESLIAILPAWLFGSLIAISFKSKLTSSKAAKFHENVYHHEKHKID